MASKLVQIGLPISVKEAKIAGSEESRHRLYSKLEVVLGNEEATVLMEHLPPVGWADVATKRDLDALESRINVRFQAVDARFEAVDARFETMEARLSAKFEHELRIFTWRVLVVLVATMSVLVTVTRLLA